MVCAALCTVLLNPALTRSVQVANVKALWSFVKAKFETILVANKLLSEQVLGLAFALTKLGWLVLLHEVDVLQNP